MPGNEERDSVHREPHRRLDHHTPDPSEEKARQTLDHEARRTQKADLSGHGVYDEPDILPGRDADTIEQDWSCTQCGYNLRGLRVGHPCPECNHVELYRPPPPDADSYRARFRERAAKVSLATGWWIAGGAALCGGLFAVLGAFMESASGGLAPGAILLAIVFAPAVEETMKIATAAIVVELRPFLFRRVEQVQVATIGAAAGFAVIENFVYLSIYIPNPSVGITVWRWTVCVALHVGCTLIASRGLIEVWQRSVRDERRARMEEGARMLIYAIFIHGAYNAAAVGYEWMPKPLFG